MLNLTEIMVCVRAWIDKRDEISSAWRLAGTGFILDARTQRGINEFAAAMDYRTRELMRILDRSGEFGPIELSRSVKDQATGPWHYNLLSAMLSRDASWTVPDQEGFYELCMNIDKWLSL